MRTVSSLPPAVFTAMVSPSMTLVTRASAGIPHAYAGCPEGSSVTFTGTVHPAMARRAPSAIPRSTKRKELFPDIAILVVVHRDKRWQAARVSRVRTGEEKGEGDPGFM